MGRPYAKELAALDSSLHWSRGIDIEDLRAFVVETSRRPLVAVGSGGSCTAAHFAALLHRHYAGSPGRHATPLELLVDRENLAQSAVLMISASGRNQDVLGAVRRAIGAEVPALGSVTMNRDNPLTREVHAFSRGFAFAEQIPAGKDGFLATNSLAASLVILARAYDVEVPTIMPSRDTTEQADIGDRPSAIVLHAGWASPVATDLESRLHESTLLNVQITDYRNFGHGRHLWLARRNTETTIVALVTPETASLARRTLRLIPAGIPVARLESTAPGPAASIELLVTALHWTGAVGELKSLDPGRPQVPAFGRRLFHLHPPRYRTGNVAPPVQRKLIRAGASDDALKQTYMTALEDYKQQLSRIEIGAVAVDYDGTLCATRDRFDPLTDEVTTACIRLLRMGLLLGVATGRGKSVRKALRAALPQELWSAITVGYYNGSDIAPLSEDTAPDKTRPKDDTISSLTSMLETDPILSALAIVEARPSQITVSRRPEAPPGDLYTYVADLLDSRSSPAHLLRSGHSIDLVSPGVSKLRVVQHLSRKVRPLEVLCIGDRGAWPGNDSQLLSHRFSLSVDQVSSALDSCWNLAPAGQLGVQATLRYLNALENQGGLIRLSVDQIMGVSS